MKISFRGIKDTFKGLFGKNEEKKVAIKSKDRIESLSVATLSGDALKLIHELYAALGERPSASKESKKAARYISELFSKYSGQVTISSNTVYKDIGKYLSLFALGTVFVSMVFVAINLPILSVAILGLLFYLFYLELKKKESKLKKLMPTGEAVNVHSVLEAEDRAERTIIFSAHLDSAVAEDSGDAKLALLKKYAPIVSALVASIVSVIGLFSALISWDLSVGLPSIALFIIAIVLALSSAFAFYLIIKEKAVSSPGCGDNLSGVAVVEELLRYYSFEKAQGRGLKNTRLIFAVFDAEEISLQGSRAWYEKHKAYLENAININFDGLYKAEDLAFITSDGNGMVNLSTPLAQELSSILNSMGYKSEVGRMGVFSGETDAASAALNGVDATTLTSMKPDLNTPAHSTADTPDKIEREALHVALSAAIKYVERLANEANGSAVEEGVFLDLDRKYKLIK